MAKNKGTHRSQKQPEPAEELASFTARALEAVRPHAFKLAALIGGVTAVLIAFGVWNWHNAKQDGEATRLYGEAMDILRAPVIAEEEIAETREGEVTYRSATERAEAALVALQKLLSEYPSRGPARQGLLVKAGVLFEVGRYEEAAAAYRDYLATGPEDYLRIVAQEGLGYALEAQARQAEDDDARKKALGEALGAFEKVQPSEEGFYRDYALYHQARLKADLGDHEGATALFKKVLEKFPATPLRSDIDARLSRLEAGGS